MLVSPSSLLGMEDCTSTYPDDIITVDQTAVYVAPDRNLGNSYIYYSVLAGTCVQDLQLLYLEL